LTVAAIVLVPDTAAALVDADGEPAIRRVVHAAWSGGALPIVLVVQETPGPFADAVADLPVTIAHPTAGEPPGIAWFVCGQRAAVQAVAETTAGLLWPFRHAWIDPETATSLVEAHGVTPDAVVRPTYAGQAGFPILLPTGLTERLAAHRGLHGAEAVAAVIGEGAAARLLELGDPGIVYDISSTRSSLPDYRGPSESATGSPLEWNADLAAHAQQSDDTSA
jgi:CTP:molybdopterin cytidylyltransferase MocA